MMRPFMKDRAAAFREHVPVGSSVLEIGCSSGYFLDAIQKDYIVFGNEWNPEDAAFVRDVRKIPCEEGDMSEVYPGETFSAICAYRVLEHVPDPIEWLKQIRSRLVVGGWLLLEVPNRNDALVSLYDIPTFKDFWYRKPHITYWRIETLTAALEQIGFEAEVSSYQEYNSNNSPINQYTRFENNMRNFNMLRQ